MMWCSNNNCGVEGPGPFCQKCGARMVVDRTLNHVVICNGQQDDGSPCHAVLVPNQKFCLNCGMRVDQGLFTSNMKTCTQCGTVLNQGSTSCLKCDQSQSKPSADNNQPYENNNLELTQGGFTREKELNEGEKGSTCSGTAVELSTLTGDAGNDEQGKQAQLNQKSKIADGPEAESNERNNTATEVERTGHGNSTVFEGKQEFGKSCLQQNDVKIMDTREGGQTDPVTSDSDTDSKSDSEVSVSQANLHASRDSPKENAMDESKRVKKKKKNKKKRKREREAKQRNQVGFIEQDISVKRENQQTPSDTKPPSFKLEANLVQEKGINNNIISQETTCIANYKEIMTENTLKNSQTGDNSTTSLSGQISSFVSDKDGQSLLSETSPKTKENNVGLEKNSIEDNVTLENDFAKEKMVFGMGKAPAIEQSVELSFAPGQSSLFVLDKKEDKTITVSESSVKTDETVPQKILSDTEKLLEVEGNEVSDGNDENGDSGEESDVNEANETEEMEKKKTEGSDVDGPVKNLSKSQIKRQRKRERKAIKAARDEGKISTGNTAGASDEKCLTVYFHVLVSEDFHFNPSKHKMMIVMGNAEMGSWYKQDREMTVHRHIEGSVYQLVYKTEIPTRLIDEKSHFPYKYFIKKEGKEGHYEHYKKNSKYGKDVNRLLCVKPEFKSFMLTYDVWHQFDGFAERAPDTVSFGKVKEMLSMTHDLTKHAEKALNEFCPQLSFIEKNSPSDVVKWIQMIVECLKRVYFTDAKCWNHPDNYKEFVGKTLIPVMVKQWKIDKTPLSTEEIETRLIGSMIIMCTLKELKIYLPAGKISQTVCKSLLVTADPKRNDCPELNFLDKHFPDKRKYLLEAIMSVVKKICGETKDPSWLFLVPLLHFLSGKCIPYQEMTMDLSHDSVMPIWWGIEDIDYQVNYFKAKTEKWAVNAVDLLEQLEPVFEMDYFLPRAFLAAADFKDLQSIFETGKVPIEVCLANLVYQMRINRPAPYTYWYGFPMETTEEKMLTKCLDTVLKQLRCLLYSDSCNVASWTISYMFGYVLLTESMMCDRNDHVCLSVQICLCCMAMYQKCLEAGKLDKTDNQKILSLTDMLKYAKNHTVHWMSTWQYNWKTYMENILKVWDRLFAPESLQSEFVRDEWNKHLAASLLNKIQTDVCSDVWCTKQFVHLYCKQFDRFIPCMQECLTEAAFQAMSSGYTVDYNRYSEDENRRLGYLLSGFFVTEWGKKVKQSQKDNETRIYETSILEHVLNWQPFHQFLEKYYVDKTKTNMLTQVCKENLVHAVSLLETKIDDLLRGSVTIDDFKLVFSKQKKFLELTEPLRSTKTSTQVSKALQMRQMELDAFQAQSVAMATLSLLCQHLKNVDRTAVDATLKEKENGQINTISAFCEPKHPDDVESVDKYVPKLFAFRVHQTVIDELPEIHRFNSSNIFHKLWTDRCRRINEENISLQNVILSVWKPVKQTLDSIANQIKSGEIKFKEFEMIVARLHKEDYGAMVKELQILKITEKCATLRTDQLKQYRELEACVSGAKTVLAFKEEFELEGDFDQIKIIATHGDNELEMASFDDSVMKACDFLKDLTPVRARCLQTFVECQQVVQWLKESIQTDGLKELNVFVELAYMSAGDEPINIARVQCLHSAVTGYAPLIFELRKKSGYKELLRHCELVWKYLEANKNLPKMLEEINRHLPWLSEIKKAHGSVECNSLMQAEAVNESGIFIVGKNAWKRDKQGDEKKDTSSSSLLVVADTVQLTVPEKDGEHAMGKKDKTVQDSGSKGKNFTFSQLQDLQSRLMLVAGKADKSKDSVDRFTMIFGNITRLSNVYLKLCSSGCVFFKDFTARFFCHQKLPVCIYLNFGQGKKAPQLKGRRSEEEDLKDIIPQIAKFMETCLDQWLSHIKEKRNSYHHLNYFTVDQLVILQRELVKVGTDEEEPNHHIYPLLSAVKQNCSPADLLDAMTAAKTEIEGQDDEEVSVEDPKDGEDLQAEDSIDEKKHNFIQELVDAGYDKGLVIRALEFVDSFDVTEGMVWCMENETAAMSDDTEATPVPENKCMREQQAQKPVFTGWSKSDTDIQTLISTNIAGLNKQEEKGARPLLEELSALWAMFLESISSNIIRDYLSLEHIGIILKHLSRKNKQEVCRLLPPVFKEGQPNLIFSPSGEVLMTLLSVYMMDEDQPLPQSDEVLMCTPNTTKDEVDIFWRRAIFNGGKKIHCLLNADLLDYDVSEAAERCLEEYIVDVSNTEPTYRLLVICGADNEYKSGIVSSLDKYKRHPLPYNIQHIRDYLLHKLVIDQHTSGIKPAALVDRERSTVRVIKSWRAGVGKTLFKERREDELSRLKGVGQYETVSIPLQEKNVDLYYVIGRLLEHASQPGEQTARLFHIDVAHEVQNGVDYLLFNLLILGCLVDRTGFVWRKSPTDLYLIEAMPLMMQTADRKPGDLQYVHQLLGILPDLTCRSPQDSLKIYQGEKPRDYKKSDQLFDDKQFHSQVFQRVFQYLYRLDRGRQLEDVNPRSPEGTPEACLETILRHCGLEDPSWAELHHFVWFLNTQLFDFEQNSFVSAAAAEDLPGFTKFVLRFLITMSRDFSTRSLVMSEESPGLKLEMKETRRVIEDEKNGVDVDDGDDVLQAYQMRRTWESSPHPYLFFNSDRVSFTFLGFYIDRGSGNLVDQQTDEILERSIMTKKLYDALIRNNAPMRENFDTLPRDQKIMKLCNVMGVEFPHDPDDTYELTTDNVKKIMAIYMRFRCDIPVIIMGETGCGKTRLIKFMCGLQVPPGVKMTNMILMKVHGGTTNRDIIKQVEKAEREAKKNIEKYGKQMYTVLFFDEANTTEAIGLIKEIMCDKSMEGTKLKLCENLKMVAAVNPYRKHSDELIRRLEQAGLGYHVDADDTTDRLGRVPMRRLVYRVQPLPQSLLPLVWDFGQLNTQVEDLYIRQMVRRYIREGKLPEKHNLKETVSAILTASQEYMRAQQDECSFVSLRDVDRVLTVMSWFYYHSQEQRTLYDHMDKILYEDDDSTSEADEDDESEDELDDIIEYRIDDLTRSLILALGVCYHACLKTRQEYRQYIAKYFRPPCRLPPDGAEQIRKEIECCQEVFLEDIDLEKNIARNMALKENVFMMVVCIELRIPLFLVGKPGSSKSLAKTIVSDAMQGNAARTDLFKELKQAQMVSFQCSPLSTPDGIVATFKQCAQYQEDKDLDTFVSIVVLDEVGLAEDSPRMPLKTLHPLLEDGCQGDEKPEEYKETLNPSLEDGCQGEEISEEYKKSLHPSLGCQGDEKPEDYKKVAFIGISNWALDPAKMNRGILVQREVPDLEELKSSARGICSTNEDVARLIEPLIEPMAISYLEVFNKASQSMREFYGLRDFYSLVKMVYKFVERSKQKPTWNEMLHAIKRNFGGLDEVDAVESFRHNLATLVHKDTQRRSHDPDSSSTGLIRACLTDTKNESRYLLLLTENYGALSIIQQQILSHSNDIHPITIFGSSFRSDLEYTQVCRNINKIKVCMETGNTVVLLNLENLYESLYDALNQYYVYFGGERYVDLGLGTHRVKCTVHKRFRLIVVAEKQTVYKKFPIPLINRLEKHFLTINTMLTPEQQRVVQKLQKWAQQFITVERQTFKRSDKVKQNIGDVFIGYHDDMCSAIVLDVWEKYYDAENPIEGENQVLQESKNVMLWCATPESLVKLDDNHIIPDLEKKYLQDQYNNRQQHGSLAQYLQHFVGTKRIDHLLSQVTTHSRLLAGVHKTEISQVTGVAVEKILLLENLSSFDTEQQFTNKIQQYLKNIGRGSGLITIQCDSGDVNANLIACARYCVRDELEKMKEHLQANVHVVFIVQLPREGKFTGFQCGQWHSVHIDDLFKEDKNMPTLQDMNGRSAAEIFSVSVKEPAEIAMDMNLHRENELAGEGICSTSASKDILTLYRRDQTVNFELCDDTRNMPVDLDDVKIDLKGVVKNVRQVSFKSHAYNFKQNVHKQVNVKGIVLNCVQAALSMVKDKTEHADRETKRVSLVLKLLHQEKEEGQSSFFHGVCCLVAKLLAEKESKVHVPSLARNWLIKEAAANENITKAGTFRRSCQQTLEAKVSPVLAGIIAYLDTNDNLSLLEDMDKPWKQEIWLLFLNASDALSLQFSDLLSPTTQSDLQEVLVMSTGYDGHLFRARMPFSWLLISKVAEILKLPNPKSTLEVCEEDAVGTESRVSSTVRVLSEHAIGSILAKITKEHDVIEATKDYIQDFVHTMYNAASEHEYQLVIQSIYNVGICNREENSLLHRLVHVHVAFETLSARLNCFRAMNSVWPECSSVIIEVKGSNPDHFMFRESDFTFSTLCLLIENLTPKSNCLNNQLGRSQWLNNVHKYRPVVEKVICLHGENPKLYGNNAVQSVRRAKCLWSRVIAVKLFLEHVCTTGKDDRIFKHCMTFWKLLGDDTDFKDITSLNGVEKFLRICYKQAMMEFIGAEEKCSQCESVLEGPPVTLPCKDVLCEHCFDALRALDENTCHKCERSFDAGWKPLKQASDNSGTEKLKDYQTRCNTFFMDVVSQLCFADNTAPREEVVSKLLGFIFITTSAQQKRTRDLTVFKTGIDPNPVFRSFLLQLLLKTSEENVIRNLRRYLDEADKFTTREDTQHVDLSLLVVQCLEDIFTQAAGMPDMDEVQYATQALKRAKVNVESEGLTVEKLYALASARMGLAIVARYVADIVKHNRDQRQVDLRVRKLIEAAQILCEDTRVEWNRVYLVKYLCRCFGIDVYETICHAPAPFLRWIAIRNMDRESVVEISDRYIVCGEMYTILRESVTKVILGENTTYLTETLQNLRKQRDKIDPLLQLAVHREVTCSNLYPPQKRKITAQIINTLEQFVDTCEFVTNKQMLQEMLHNQLVPSGLVVQEGEDLHQQGIICLIVHYLTVMSNIQGDRTLLDPLISLIKRPESMLNAFLPTMPQDELEDAKEALLAARNQISGADDNPVFYKCPNGHIYVIGNCGRPSVVDRCTCGAEIGGQNHNLLPSNTQYTGRDTTLTGHILGRAEARAHGAQPERELSPAHCSAIRLIVHMALYLGTGNNPQGIQNMITPDIMVNEVEEFFYHHIHRDLDDMRISLGLSLDDIILLMHAVIDGISRGFKKGGHVRAQVNHWSSKASRRDWETAFSSKFIQPLFMDISSLLKKNNQLLAKDQRLGADPLLCLLYETDTETEEENAAMLERIPRVWRYRTPVSLQHLRQEVQAKVRHIEHKVLQLFLHEEHILRAMRYIPSILRLHRALFQKYQRKLDKAEASQITVAQLRKEEVAGGETNQLLQDFIDAWELVRSSLFLYLCPTEIGGTTVAKEYCIRKITDKTPIAMLLPTTKEAGLCSFALLDFLFRKQNDFLDKYFKEAKRDPASMSTVQPRDVTSAHLISYDPQHDIMPLILANCQYSFEIGKGTKIDYDFAALERQLMDRFLFSKSRIHIGRVLEIDLMQYRTEFTNAEVFRKLDDNIPQEALSTVVKARIISECKSLPDLCQSLDNLDITISFLKSTGGPTDRRLHEFMRETLQMVSSIYSQKAQQCEFRHLKSLWLLLSLQKSKKMADSLQHTESIFESVSVDFHEELPEELYTLFNEYAMNKLSIEKLAQLIEILHEFILLVVAVRQHPTDDNTVSTDKKLCEWLTGYLESFEQPPLDVVILAGFPDDILYKHSVHTWMSAYTILKQKQSRDRY